MFGFGSGPRRMTRKDWDNYTRTSSFGMDYSVPGTLGGLGGGYVQPSMMFGKQYVDVLFQKFRDDPTLAKRLETAANLGRRSQFGKILSD